LFFPSKIRHFAERSKNAMGKNSLRFTPPAEASARRSFSVGGSIPHARTGALAGRSGDQGVAKAGSIPVSFADADFKPGALHRLKVIYYKQHFIELSISESLFCFPDRLLLLNITLFLIHWFQFSLIGLELK